MYKKMSQKLIKCAKKLREYFKNLRVWLSSSKMISVEKLVMCA